MASFNKVILMGNLTKDPELRYTSSGLAVANFSLAINRKTTKEGEKKEEVDFFDIETWDKQAELCSEYLSKGRSVLIEGRLKQDRWEDETGSKRSRVKIVATAIQFLPKRSEEDAEGGGKGDFSDGNISEGKDIAPF
jgi:single-strand DNA-binding protein